jgi:hypothetical protein
LIHKDFFSKKSHRAFGWDTLRSRFFLYSITTSGTSLFRSLVAGFEIGCGCRCPPMGLCGRVPAPPRLKLARGIHEGTRHVPDCTSRRLRAVSISVRTRSNLGVSDEVDRTNAASAAVVLGRLCAPRPPRPAEMLVEGPTGDARYNLLGGVGAGNGGPAWGHLRWYWTGIALNRRQPRKPFVSVEFPRFLGIKPSGFEVSFYRVDPLLLNLRLCFGTPVSNGGVGQ